MSSEDDFLAEALAGLPLPALSRATSQRTLALARGNLVPPARAEPWSILARLPAHAVPAILMSADVVFVADACIKMARAFR